MLSTFQKKEVSHQSAKSSLFRNSRGIASSGQVNYGKPQASPERKGGQRLFKKKGGSWDGLFWIKVHWRKMRVLSGGGLSLAPCEGSLLVLSQANFLPSSCWTMQLQLMVCVWDSSLHGFWTPILSEVSLTHFHISSFWSRSFFESITDQELDHLFLIVIVFAPWLHQGPFLGVT